MTKHNCYANITSMNNFNTNRNFQNKNSNERIKTHFQRTAEIRARDEKRVKQQKLLGATAIAGLLTTGAMGIAGYNTIKDNVETTNEKANETGVHSIDVSHFDTYKSHRDGDNIAVTISEGGRIRSEPKVTGKFDEPNILYKAENYERYEINIDYEFSEQQEIPVLRHDDGRNPEWIGLAIETLPEETQDKLGRDSDGIAWVNQQKANVYIGHSEEGPTQTKLD